ncbi:MAG: def [Bacillales bacterium]|jgi:peptide deformylase|nr:def [Bacillales bacterium]
MLTGKEILTDGHPNLRKRAAAVTMPPSEEDKGTLAEMLEFLINSQNPEFAEMHGIRPGIGLAAPQINILKRMIAVYIEVPESEPISLALFNPRIISHSVEKTYITSGEGCLSVEQNYPGFVPRYAKVRVKANTINGEEIEIHAKGLLAICLQHEIDHLNGILYYDHINKENPFGEIEFAIPYDRT